MNTNIRILLLLLPLTIACSKLPEETIVQKQGMTFLNQNTKIINNTIYYLEDTHLSKIVIPSSESQMIATLPSTQYNDLIYDLDDQSVYYMQLVVSGYIQEYTVKTIQFSSPQTISTLYKTQTVIYDLAVNDESVFLLELMKNRITKVDRTTAISEEIVSDLSTMNQVYSIAADNDYVYYVNNKNWLNRYNIKTKKTTGMCQVGEFPGGVSSMRLCNGSLLVPQKDYLLSVDISADSTLPAILFQGSYSLIGESDLYLNGKNIFLLKYADYTGNYNTSTLRKYISHIYAMDPAGSTPRLIKSFYQEHGYYLEGFYGIVEDASNYYVATAQDIITIKK